MRRRLVRFLVCSRNGEQVGTVTVEDDGSGKEAMLEAAMRKAISLGHQKDCQVVPETPLA